ncbi:periplasmic serine protease, Do [Nitrospirillum viridazoti Y2]|uniref:Probable periplasmic serine endoprotease DegP-like n=1 Tax=Nitrospirillum amazonense TaxID=28077 RepID=A0A560HZU4_9PROT|nr:DegQ family serine endoprotease [Nitrospirillum amazonense]EGX99710.1 periplasmic serine protease, Do [Nitrospirillum amazonense Y2]TWB52177.1 serine protease Do [Nitrospirillum amazonense]
MTSPAFTASSPTASSPRKEGLRRFPALRRSLMVLGVLLLPTACGDPAPARAEPPPHSFAPLVEKMLPAVVNISTTQTMKNKKQGQLPMPEFPPGSPFGDFFRDYQQRQKENDQGGGGDDKGGATSLGSGFIIDASGYVVTNNHVIEGADEITVRLQDDTQMKATLVGTDKATDIALLKVEPSSKLPAMVWGNSDALKVGDWVVAIGNPFGLGGTVTAGIISARGRDIGAGKYDDFLQTDASINLGNSGGPLINLNGEVIGMNTAIFSPGSNEGEAGSVGIGFAIPAVVIKNVVQQLRETGKVRRGWLGVQIQDVTPDIADTLNLKQQRGALVAVVSPGGPGEQAGLKQGDVIISIDGKDVTNGRMLPRIVAEEPVGHKAALVVLRKGGKTNVTVSLGELKEDTEGGAAIAATGNGPAEAEGTIDSVGLTLDALSPKIRQKFSVRDDAQGVAVVRVAPNSPAAKREIKAGDLIVEVGQEEVSTPNDVATRVAKAKDNGQKAVLLLVERAGDLLFVALPLE